MSGEKRSDTCKWATTDGYGRCLFPVVGWISAHDSSNTSCPMHCDRCATYEHKETKPPPEPPHTVSVAAHVKAAIESLKKAQTVLQIERERLENLLR